MVSRRLFLQQACCAGATLGLACVLGVLWIRSFIETFRRFPTGLTEYELNHPQVASRLVEGRRWLRETGARYDLILVNLPIPATLQLNRYYTLEFFRLAQQRLKPGGILAINLPGSETVLTPELKALNQTLHATLRGVFAQVRIVAGDQNLFVASTDPAIASVGPDQLVERLHARSIAADLISAPYLRYRTDPRRIASFERDIAASGHQPPNRDMHPRGVTQALAYLNSVVSPFMVGFLAAIEHVRLVHWLAAIAAATLLALHVQHGRRPRLFLGYAIATTGFASMLLYLLLIFSLQIHYGHVYHYIGLLTALFMLGADALPDSRSSSGVVTARRVGTSPERMRATSRAASKLISATASQFCNIPAWRRRWSSICPGRVGG